MIIISLVEIVLFCYDAAHGNTDARGRIASVLIYNPHKRYEAWRFVSYMLVHVGVMHLVVNLLVQLFLGVPLEMVHCWWRVSLVYLAGVAAGSLATSLTDPKVYLAGASGGVYALLAAHIATIVMHDALDESLSIVLSFSFVTLREKDSPTERPCSGCRAGPAGYDFVRIARSGTVLTSVSVYTGGNHFVNNSTLSKPDEAANSTAAISFTTYSLLSLTGFCSQLRGQGLSLPPIGYWQQQCSREIQVQDRSGVGIASGTGKGINSTSEDRLTTERLRRYGTLYVRCERSEKVRDSRLGRHARPAAIGIENVARTEIGRCNNIVVVVDGVIGRYERLENSFDVHADGAAGGS
ncbi:Rhomboid-related protein 2 [Eumeta japonica]|uniref:Rhomboid-related protein 2 n=1 Tax=Eumeta variegata TaxID=151549 RepID=A0A4C1VKR5_EUMVA|nr:Rhomboid-related protein 2 [Eumeta japonica]